jgi:ribosome-associated protein
MPQIRITPEITIDETELDESFVLASGPGGQNVNKVSSAVQLRFNIALSTSLPEPVRYRLMTTLKSRLTKDGVLVIVGRKYRDQNRNREDVRARLSELIAAAAIEPKKRFKTKPSRGAKEERLQHKKKHAELKRGRSKVRDD